MHAAEAALGYVVNSNLQLNIGWERYRYGRDIGLFYNGAPDITMNAGFLHAQFQI